ncbi:MAG: AgmX/PglI C-terminal domain-containing protein [Polyangiaceae bacterium]
MHFASYRFCSPLIVIALASGGCGGGAKTAPNPHAAPTSSASVATKSAPAPVLTPDLIKQTVQTNAKSVKLCYDEGLKRNPKLRGTVNTRFVIGADGLVKSSELHVDETHPAFPDAKVAACVLETFTALVFAKPKSGTGTVSVTYPWVLTPEE